VLQDKRFKNRELQIMKLLKHPNVCALRHHFYQTVEKKTESGAREEETYLNLVLEYVPDTVYKVTRSHVKQRTLPPMLAVKLYVYQMCRSLAYLHSVGICHRDIKPQNLLVDSATHVLKLCDFGSAKALLPGEPSVAYICSRYYRAPELIFGATEYTVRHWPHWPHRAAARVCVCACHANARHPPRPPIPYTPHHSHAARTRC